MVEPMNEIAATLRQSFDDYDDIHDVQRKLRRGRWNITTKSGRTYDRAIIDHVRGKSRASGFEITELAVTTMESSKDRCFRLKLSAIDTAARHIEVAPSDERRARLAARLADRQQVTR
jgi:hypothetical protein